MDAGLASMSSGELTEWIALYKLEYDEQEKARRSSELEAKSKRGRR